WSPAGVEIPVERVLYSGRGELQLVPAEKLDIKRWYRVQTPYRKQKLVTRYDGWFAHLYSDKPLGARFFPAKNMTTIRLFAPRADSVFVFLYRQPFGKPVYRKSLAADTDGVWQIDLPGNWQGWYYDFAAYGPAISGNYFSSSKKVIHFSDPWGQVSVDSFGPCRIWPRQNPPEPLPGGIPKMQDVIAYEVHVQDFTRNLPLPDSLRGTFRGFVMPGLKNSHGQKIGFDHLPEFGINVVHLMPVQEYLHYPDAEWQKAFKVDPYMTAQGINLENYQWGYRTSHAFALESRYRVKGSAWGSQNRDFRDLVQAFHRRHIAVVVDVVFNHTAERMDGRRFFFNFLAMDAPYFYRMDEWFRFLGPYGTETKSELRPMTQRWIIEQCRNLVEQYGVDGFRIDLAGLTDKQTLRMLRQELGPEMLIYGEPWIDSADPEFEANPDWNWYKQDAPITFFQDEARNAFKGPPSDPKDKTKDRGYAGGNGDREAVKRALSAGFPSDKTPLSGINYLDIHDNWALADRFASRDWDGRLGVDEQPYKIAAALLFTSLGPIVLHGGSELMRSKGAAPDSEVVKYLNGKPLYFHGRKDSYNLAKANAFIWENKGLNRGQMPGVFCNYDNMYRFWRGLVALRKSRYGRVFRIANRPAPDYYRWIEPPDSRLLGYVVANTVLVLINTDQRPGEFKFAVPPGNWRLIADIERVDLNGISGYSFSRLSAPGKTRVTVPPQALFIWVNE
ncbi:MAG TPA: pullulanase, partial [Caldithrix abyssi]|nr:pullulanase [Caldithrix abyssi]